jgi:phosphate-selective porin OprO/OprP
MRRINAALLFAAVGTAFSQSNDSAQIQASTRQIAEDHQALIANQEKLDALDGQIKILQRLREIDKEDAAAAAVAAPKIQAEAGGIWIRSADSSFGFRPRGIVRTGANWDLDDKNNVTTDLFQLQTARLGSDVVLGKVVEGRVLLDISKGNSAALQDGYFDLKLAPWAVVRTGKFQTPLGWERSLSSSDLLFYDRALPSQIAPNRDVGFQLSGTVGKGVFEYAFGVFDGGTDGSNIDKDVNDDKDLYARVVLSPAKNSGETWLEGLSLGIAGSGGNHTNIASSSYKTTSGNTFFSWNSTDSLGGTGWRIAPQLSWTASSYALWGEWIGSREVVFRGAATTFTTDSVSKSVVYGTAKKTTALGGKAFFTQAWQGGLSWVVTGEDASFSGVKPRHPFGKDGWGALELAARISQLVADENAFHGASYADSTKSAKEALSFGAAVNWHLVKGTRLQAGYERTQFSDGAVVDPTAKVKVVRDRKPENQLFVVASTSF